MFRFATVLIFLILIACGKEEKKEPEAAPIDTVAQALAQCSFTGTVAHPFQDWGTQTADKYSCPFLEKMDCEYARNDSVSELKCTSNPADPQGVPSGCSFANTGSRVFWTSGLGPANAYDCGQAFGLKLRCHYYSRSSGGTEENLVCL